MIDRDDAVEIVGGTTPNAESANVSKNVAVNMFDVLIDASKRNGAVLPTCVRYKLRVAFVLSEVVAGGNITLIAPKLVVMAADAGDGRDSPYAVRYVYLY
jgi:hypothetical protein